MVRIKKEESKIKEVSLESMERLARIMNDSPTIVKMGKTEFPITALKMGTQWMIAEESCKILKNETSNFSDVIKQFSLNTPSVVRIITLAILNDKNRIYSDEYKIVYDTIMWETNPSHWIGLLVEIMDMLSLEFFFQTTQSIETIRQMALGRKKTMDEQKSLLAEQNGGK